MNRIQFIGIASGKVIATVTTSYLLSDKSNLLRTDIKPANEQTIVANRLQSYRAPAQQELANWIRFSSKDAEKYGDGLTTASMEID